MVLFFSLLLEREEGWRNNAAGTDFRRTRNVNENQIEYHQYQIEVEFRFSFYTKKKCILPVSESVEATGFHD